MIIAVLPATSVDRERGFSNLTQIKNTDRNCLQGDHLEALMWISTTKVDAMTLSHEHWDALTLRWRRMKVRRDGGKGERAYDAILL